MKKIVYLLLFTAYTSYAQDTFNLTTTITTKADFITADNQSNVYVVKGDELSKYNKTGKLLYKYSNKNLGKIDFVDASYMLKPFLFYKNFLQIVYLDNTLSLNGDPVILDDPATPDEVEYEQAQLACTSYNGCVWLYDQENMELVRLDQNLKKTVGTGNLSILLNIDLQPNYLIEHDNKVYLNNPSSGILIFDVFGTYYKTVPIKNITHFEPIGDWVYFMTEDNKIDAYQLKTGNTIQFKVPHVDFTNFRLETDILMLQNKDSILFYGK